MAWPPLQLSADDLIRTGDRTCCHADSCKQQLAELQALLLQHSKQLEQYIDGRLQAHHADLLQHIRCDPLHSGALGESTVTPHTKRVASHSIPKDSIPEAEPKQGEMLESHGTTVFSSESNSISETASFRGSVPLDSYHDHERLRKARSRQMSAAARTVTRVSGHNELPSARRCVESQYFEGIICLLIISNACFLGFEVQSRIDVTEEDVRFNYRMVEYIYTGCFAIELAFRIRAYGFATFMCGTARAWNLFDFSLVLISFLEVIMSLYQTNAPKLEHARIVRMARTVRIARIVRVMNFFRPLRILVFSITATVRSLFWTVLLLMIIVYLFGVMFTVASEQALASDSSSDPRLLEKHWGTLWLSTVTLFKSITGGSDWEDGLEALYTIHQLWALLFMAFIAFSHLALLNVVTGVVCHHALESAQQDQDLMAQQQMACKQKYIERLQSLFHRVDSDRSGKLTLQEFEDHLQDDSLQAYFAAMDLTTDEAWTFFKLLDRSESCAIDLDEFVSGCLRLRGAARSIDVHMLMYENKWTMNKLTSLMRSITEIPHRISQSAHLGATPSRESSATTCDVDIVAM